MDSKQHRILIVDDNESIHKDFKIILNPPTSNTIKLESIENELFNKKKLNQ